MSEMDNMQGRSASVRVTVLAVRRVAAMAERALREQGYTDADSILQDALAAALIAEDALAMEQAGDELAEPLAREALRMAKESLRAANKPAPAAAAPAAAAGAPAAPATPAPAPASAPATPAAPAPTPVPAPASAPAAPEPAPAAPAPEPQNVSRETFVPAALADAARDLPAPAPAQPAPAAPSFEAPIPTRSDIELPLRPLEPSAPASGTGRHARIDLPEIAPAPQPAPAPAPQPAPAPAPQPAPAPAPQPAPAPAPQPAPAPAPAPAVPRERSERGFSIPYGPSTVEPGEDEFFAAAPQDGPDALHAAPAPAPAPAKPRKPKAPKPRKPKAAKRVCATLAIALVVMAGLVGAAWWGFFDLPEPVQRRIELLPDPHARQGRLNAANVDVAPGSYQLVLNQVATMEAGSRTLPIAFENPAANTHASRLELALDGQRVASTNMVEPGFYVESVELARTLSQGEHELSATVYVYSGATQINTMSANVTVRVK